MFVKSLALFAIFILTISVYCVDLDPDVTLNRKLDPNLADSANVLPNFKAVFDGKDTQVWNLVNGSHWTIPGEHTSDEELKPYRPVSQN